MRVPVVIELDPVSDDSHRMLLGLEAVTMHTLFLQGPDNALDRAVMGDTDRALEWLNKSAQEQGGAFGPTDRLLQPLADDPRWLRLLESIGRTPGQWDSVEFKVKLPAQ